MCGSRFTRTEILGALSAGLLVVLFCLILLWHNPLVFWNDDYELSVLPVFADMARSWSEGHWPILSPYSWVCGNFAGEFQYGTFSVKFAREIAADPRIRTQDRPMTFRPAARHVGEHWQH